MFYFRGIPATAAPFEPRRVHSRSLKRAVFLFRGVGVCGGSRGFLRNPAVREAVAFGASTEPPPPVPPSLRAAAASVRERFSLKIRWRGKKIGKERFSRRSHSTAPQNDSVEIISDRFLAVARNDILLSLRCRAHARPWESRLPTGIYGRSQYLRRITPFRFFIGDFVAKCPTLC